MKEKKEKRQVFKYTVYIGEEEVKEDGRRPDDGEPTNTENVNSRWIQRVRVARTLFFSFSGK